MEYKNKDHENHSIGLHIFWSLVLSITILVANRGAQTTQAQLLDLKTTETTKPTSWRSAFVEYTNEPYRVSNRIKCSEPSENNTEKVTYLLKCPLTSPQGSKITCPAGSQPYLIETATKLEPGWYCAKTDTAPKTVTTYVLELPAAKPAVEPAAPAAPEETTAPTDKPAETPKPADPAPTPATPTPAEPTPAPATPSEPSAASEKPLTRAEPAVEVKKEEIPAEPEAKKTEEEKSAEKERPVAEKQTTEEEKTNRISLRKPVRQIPKEMRRIPVRPTKFSNIKEDSPQSATLQKLFTAMIEKGNFEIPNNGLFQPTKKTWSFFAYQMALTVAGESCQSVIRTTSIKRACTAKLSALGWEKEYRPRALSKAQYYELLLRAAKLEPAKNEYMNLCKDLPTDDPRYATFAAAAEHRILKRYKVKGEGGYCLPDKPLSRQEAALMAAKLLP